MIADCSKCCTAVKNKPLLLGTSGLPRNRSGRKMCRKRKDGITERRFFIILRNYPQERIDHVVVAVYSTEDDPDRLRLGLFCHTGIEMQGEDFCYLDKFIAKEEKKQRGLPLWLKLEPPALPEEGEET